MAERTNKYQKALSARIREDEKKARQQERLRKTYDVSGDVFVVKKKPLGKLLSAGVLLGKIVMGILSFLFVVVCLDPTMRALFFEMPLFALFKGMK